MDRRPYDYARAVLRGWGLTEPEANIVVSPIDRLGNEGARVYVPLAPVVGK